MQVLDEQLLTVTEAAEILRVAPSTVRRWIRDGDVRALRVGKRRVAVRKSDLTAMVAPITGSRAQQSGPSQGDGERWRLASKLSPEEQASALAVIDDQRRLRAEMLAERGGRPFSPAWIIVNESRDDRTEELP